jgi:hypothetical protein
MGGLGGKQVDQRNALNGVTAGNDSVPSIVKMGNAYRLPTVVFNMSSFFSPPRSDDGGDGLAMEDPGL